MAHNDPLQAASDPATDSERLRELAEHWNLEVKQAAWRNPSLPEDAWRKAVLLGVPEAWTNPMVSIYVLTWTPRKNDLRTLDEAARWATKALWENSERIGPDGKAVIVAKIQEWWATSSDAIPMVIFLGWWAHAKGNGSPEHRQVVHILVLCMRTEPDFEDEDYLALDFLKSWSAGGKDRRKKAETLADSEAVRDTCRFAVHLNTPWSAITEVLMSITSNKKGTERKDAIAEHSRLLADLIRREMPLPPVVE